MAMSSIVSASVQVLGLTIGRDVGGISAVVGLSAVRDLRQSDPGTGGDIHG